MSPQFVDLIIRPLQITDSVVSGLERQWKLSQTQTEHTAQSPLTELDRFARDCALDLVASRHAAYRLFRRSITQRYRYSSLGLFWVFAPSAVAALVVSAGQLAHMQMLSPTDVPGQFYAIFGIILLQTFVEPFNSQRTLFSNNRHLLARHRLVLEASFLAALADNLFSLLVKLPIVAFLFVAFHVHVGAAIIVGLLVFPMVILTGAVCGLLLSPVSALRGDLNHLSTFMPLALITITPVLVEPQHQRLLSHVYTYNPLSYLFDAARHMCYGAATMGDAAVLLIGSAALFILLPVAWAFCRVSRPYIVERSLV